MLHGLIEKLFFAMLTCLHMAVQVWGENMWGIYHYCTAAALVIFVCPVLFGRTRGAQGALSGKCVSGGSMEERIKCACAWKTTNRKQKHTQLHVVKTHTHTQANIINTQRKPRWIWCKLFSLAATSPSPVPPPIPALFSKAVTAAALIMKGKIFYSDLLIWKWSMPVDRGTVLLNLSTRSHSALTPGFICLVGSDSRILPVLYGEGSPRDFLSWIKHIPTRNSLFINAN